MAIERANVALNETPSELAIIEYLKHATGSSLEAIDQITGRQLKLVLNGNGQLCYQDGVNKKLLAANTKLALLSVMPMVEETPAEIPQMKQRWSDEEYRRIANGINALIDDLTSGDVEYDDEVEDEEEDWQQDAENDADEDPWTYFRLRVPAYYTATDLASNYYDAIQESIDEAYKDAVDMGKTPLRITTEGYVRNLKAVKNQLESFLRAGNFEYDYIAPQKPYAYTKMRIWRDTMYMEDEDSDIPF